MSRTAIYARVSTARQEEEETVKSQLGACKDKIAQDGFDTNKTLIYKDEGFSGSNLERPALDRLCKDAKKGLFDVLYVFDYGRLSRDLTDLMVVKDEIEGSSIKVVSLFERVTGDSDTDRLLLQIMGAVHEYERKKIARRFHNGKIQKAKRGELVGYSPPYGYEYDKLNKTLSVYEPEAAVVRQMFNWVGVEGISLNAAIHRLHDLGIAPKRSKSEYWTKGPVRRLLCNETYIGKHYYNKSKAVMPKYRLNDNKYRKQQKTGREQRDRSEWIAHDVTPLVSENIFLKVQDQLDRNIKFRNTNRRYEYLLTGLIFCKCGSRRNGDGPNDKKYYRCSSRGKEFDGINRCAVGGLNVKLTDALVWDQISLLLSNPKELEKHATRWKEKLESNKAEDTTDLLIKESQKLKNESDRYVSAYGKGLIDEETFEKKIKPINKRINSIEDTISRASKNRGKSDKIDIDSLVRRATQKLTNLDFSQKKFIIERAVTKIVSTPQELIICGNIPINLGLQPGKVKYEPKNRNRRIA